MPWKIVSLNIEGDKHLDRVQAFMKHHNPDIIALQEVFAADLPWFQEHLPEWSYQQFAPMVSYRAPNRYNIAPRGVWGLAILSKRVPDKTFTYTYHGQAGEVPVFTDGMPNSVNRVVIGGEWSGTVDSTPVRLLNTHFTWCPDGQVTDEQREDFDQLQAYLQQQPSHILVGDFNTPRGSELFDALSQEYQDNISPQVTTTIDKQFHYAGDLQIVVDGFFTQPPYQAQVTVEKGVSDHKPLVGVVRA